MDLSSSKKFLTLQLLKPEYSGINRSIPLFPKQNSVQGLKSGRSIQETLHIYSYKRYDERTKREFIAVQLQTLNLIFTQIKIENIHH